MKGTLNWAAERMSTQQDKSFGMYQEAARLQATGVDVIHLEVGTSSSDTPAHIKKAAKDALDAGVVHYGDLQGSLELRKALSDKLRNSNGIAADPDEILLTNGLTQAAFATFMATLDPGDEVIHLEPGYPQHLPKIMLVGGRIISVPFTENFRVDADSVEAAITPLTKMLLLVNPVNPVGTVYTKDELIALAAIAIEHDLLVVTDEIYELVVYDGRAHVSIASLPGMWERTVSLFGFGKAYSMDGWRLGYAVAERQLLEQIMKVTLNETTHPCVFAQHGALAAVAGSQECIREAVDEDRRRRDLVHARLNQMPGVSCQLPEGAIYAFPSIERLGVSSDAFAHYLLTEKHVATEAGAFYGPSGEGHLRICFASEPYARLEEAMNRMEEAIAEMPDISEA